MLTKRFIISLAVLMTLIVFVEGCGKCYRVTDTNSGRVYYTSHVECNRCGTAEFYDVVTGEIVMVQSACVEKVRKCECKNRVEKSCGNPCPRSSPCSRATPCRGFAI